MNAAYDVRRLDEPENAYGDPDTAYLIGHLSLRDTLSEETLALLTNMRLPVEAVTEMDRLVNVDGLSPRRRRPPVDGGQRRDGRRLGILTEPGGPRVGRIATSRRYSAGTPTPATRSIMAATAAICGPCWR